MADTKLDVIVKLKDEFTAELDRLKGSTTGVSDSLKKVGAGVTAIGAGAALGLAGAVSTFMDFEKQMSSVQAVTGVTGQEFEDMTALAKSLGATTKFSALEAGQGMQELGAAGFEAAEVMETIGGTMDLAAASGVGLSQAADIMSSTLRGYRLESEDAAKVTDVLAKTMSSSNAEMADIGEAMKYLGPTASQMGISFEESAAMVGILANSGLKGSVATQSLSSALTRLAAPTDKMRSTMSQLGVDFYDAQGQFVGMKDMVGQLEQSFVGLTDEQQQAALANIFGLEAMKQVQTLMGEGSEGLGEYTEELRNATGTAEEMARVQQDNLAGSLELLSGAWDGLKLSIGEAMAPMIRAIADAFAFLLDIFNSMPAGVQTVVGTLMLLVAAVGLVGGPILLLIGFLPAMAAGFTIVAAALAPLVAGILAIIWPVTAVIAAIGLLYLAWTNNFGGIQEKTAAAWAWITEKFTEAKDFITNTVGAILTNLTEKWDAIKAMFTDRMEMINTEIDKFWNMYGDTITTIWNAIQVVIDTVWKVIQDIITIGLAEVQALWALTWGAVQIAVTTVWAIISTAIESAWLFISGLITAGLQILQGDWSGAWETMGSTFSDIWDGMKEAAAAAWETISGIIEKIITGVGKAVNKLKSLATFGLAGGGGGPPKATGGYVRAGVTYPVGERGPEMFTPQRSGYIIPNNKMGGGGVTINITGQFLSEDAAEAMGDAVLRNLKLNNSMI